MGNPRLGDQVLDPACGTGGFLTSAIENIRAQDVRSIEDVKMLEDTIRGQELKPLPFMLCVTNLILHDIEVPNVMNGDSLNREYTSITERDRVDVILANPPFGASVSDGVETNYPAQFRTTESADLFLLLMIRLIKNGGRAAIVLPDGSLTGDGVKQRIREEFLTQCTGDVSKVGYFLDIPDEFKIKSLCSNDLILNIAVKSKEAVQKLLRNPL